MMQINNDALGSQKELQVILMLSLDIFKKRANKVLFLSKYQLYILLLIYNCFTLYTL